MTEHVTSFEARVLELQRKIQYSFGIFSSAAVELEGLCQEYSRATGRPIAPALLSRPISVLAHPLDQLQGHFQPRSLNGPWADVQQTSCQHQATSAFISTAAGLAQVSNAPATGRSRQGRQERDSRPQANRPSSESHGRHQSLADARNLTTLPQQLCNSAKTPRYGQTAAVNHLCKQLNTARDAVTDTDIASAAAEQEESAQKAAAIQQDVGQSGAQQAGAFLQRFNQQRMPNSETDGDTDRVVASDSLSSRISTSDADVEEQAEDSGQADQQQLDINAVEPIPTAATELVDVAARGETHTGMFRVSRPDSLRGHRTAGVFINDPVSLAATENGQLANNNDIPPELENDTSFIAHQQDQLAWVLTALSHARRRLGWTHIDPDDADDGQQATAEEQELEDSSIDMGRGNTCLEQEMQQSAGDGVEAADDEAADHEAVDDVAARPKRRRKQTKVTRRSSAAEHALDFTSDSESEQQQGQAAPNAFTDLLQSLSDLHSAAAAGAAAAKGAASAVEAGTGVTASPVFCSGKMQEKLAVMQKLVQEDVGRLAREWEQQELPKMQVVAAAVWQRVHKEVPKWELNVAKARDTLEAGMQEMAISNTDDVEGYTAARKSRSEALRGWVGMYEGAKYVLSIAQLAEPPEQNQQPPDADEAGDKRTACAAAGKTPVSRAAAADGGPATAKADTGPATSDADSEESGSESSTGIAGDSTGNSSDDFIDDSMLPKSVAPAGSAACGSGQQRPAASADAVAGDADIADADVQSSESGAAAPPKAWNVPHLAPGSTQVLLGATRLRRQQQQAASLQQQDQQLPGGGSDECMQPPGKLESQEAVSEQHQGSNLHVEQEGLLEEGSSAEQPTKNLQLASEAAVAETAADVAAADLVVADQAVAQAPVHHHCWTSPSARRGSLQPADNAAAAAEQPAIESSYDHNVTADEAAVEVQAATSEVDAAAASNRPGVDEGEAVLTVSEATAAAADQAGLEGSMPAARETFAVPIASAAISLQRSEDVPAAGAVAVHVRMTASEQQPAANDSAAAPFAVHIEVAGAGVEPAADVATAVTTAVDMVQVHATLQIADDEQASGLRPAEGIEADELIGECEVADIVYEPAEIPAAAYERDAEHAGQPSSMPAREQQATPKASDAATIEQTAQAALEPVNAAAHDQLMQDADLEDDDVECVIFTRTQRPSSSGNSQALAEAAADHAAAVKSEDKQQQQQELPVPAVDLDTLDIPEILREASSGEVAAPACEYVYPCTVVKEDEVSSELQLGQPCELLQAVSGGEHVTWRNMMLVQRTTVQPRWHSWQEAAAVLDVDQQASLVTVKKCKGRNERVPLSSVRPPPPLNLCRLVPHEIPATSSSIKAWANSSEGLLHLSKRLRPGVLLEFRKQHSQSWAPAVILHSRMIRPALSSRMKQVLQQQSTAAAEGTSLAAAGQQRSPSPAAAGDKRVNVAGLLEAGEWLRTTGHPAGPTSTQNTKQYAPPDEDDVVLVLLMLDSAFSVDVRHVTWGTLLESSPQFRYMLHWTTNFADAIEGSSGSSESADAAAKSDSVSTADSGQSSPATDQTDGGSYLLKGRWQRLLKFTCLPVHRWAKQQLEHEHKLWLKSIGWPRRSRGRRAAQDLLSEEQLRIIARKLARRPTCIAVTPALKVAAGVESSATKLGRKVQRRHKIALRAYIGDDLGAPAAAPAQADGAQRPKRKHRQVVKDDSDSDAQPKVKRQRTRGNRLAQEQQLSSEDEEFSMNDLAASPPMRSKRPLRRRLTGGSQPATAAVSSSTSTPDASTSADSDESFDSEAVSSADVSDSDPDYDSDEEDGRLVLQDGMSLLYEDEPAGPLNPRLPRCWLIPGQSADKQVMKPHQLNGVRFMYDCLVKEHSSGAMERRQQEKKRKNKNKQKSRKRGRRRAADEVSRDSDFESSDGGSENQSDLIQDSEGDDSHGEHSEADDAGGCILAHSMGLGKSFQTVALLWVFFQRSRGHALLVVPTNVVANWVDEFRTWLPSRGDQDYKASHLRPHKVFMATTGGKNLARQVDKWMRYKGSVLVLSYDVFMRAVKSDTKEAPLQHGRVSQLARESNFQTDSPAVSMNADVVAACDSDEQDEDEDSEGLVRSPASMKERVRKALLHGASVVVADEAHQMKNADTQKCRWMRQVSTMRRLALTGYPLQNKLDEYFQMILWVQPEELFMHYKEFRSKFVIPISKGQEPDADAPARRTMARQLSVLHDYTASFIQRAGPEVLLRDLPPKREYVLALAPTTTQTRLLGNFLDCIQNRSLFRDYRMMRKILDTRDHGYADLLQAAEAARVGSSAELHDADAAADGSDMHEQLLVQATGRGSKNLNAVSLEVIEALLQEYPQHQQLVRQQQEASAAAVGGQCDTEATGEQGLLPKEVFIRQLIQKACVEAGEKVVIFSESLIVLDSLEALMQDEFGYQLERHYLRLQGSTDANERRRLIRKFNSSKQQAKVFLISTLAGSVGINLVSARRLVLYDLPWNPVHNRQAVSRVWRYGQTRPCFLYHLMYSGTVEQHMYEQTLAKLELFERVVERQSRRAALNYLSQQLDSKAYMLHPVNRMDDAQLAQRVQAVLTPAAAPAASSAASGAATAAAVEADELLMQILQDPATVDSLALADLKNHEEMLQDDPTAKLDAAERRRAVAAYERERRQASFYSTAALHYGATQNPLGADGISDRTRRLQRRIQLRLEQIHGKGFIDTEEPEPEY